MPKYYLPDGTPIREDATLRDEFAAAALTGIISNGEMLSREVTHMMTQGNPDSNDLHKVAAMIAYGYADAMLRVRDK